MTQDNPITRPMSTLLDKSVRAATWLAGATQYEAGVALARLLAGQIDDAVEGGQITDPEVLKQFHMRMVPNFQRALHALGLTPEGYAKMTGVRSPAGQAKGTEAAGTTGVASPFDTAGKPAVDPLEALITEEDLRANVVDLESRR